MSHSDIILSLSVVIFLQYSVTDVWSVPYVGTVVNGIINGGTVKTGEVILLGPDSNGNYQSTVVKSMQRKRYVLCTPSIRIISIISVEEQP
jgi:GTPase